FRENTGEKMCARPQEKTRTTSSTKRDSNSKPADRCLFAEGLQQSYADLAPLPNFSWQRERVPVWKAKRAKRDRRFLERSQPHRTISHDREDQADGLLLPQGVRQVGRRIRILQNDRRTR